MLNWFKIFSSNNNLTNVEKSSSTCPKIDQNWPPQYGTSLKGLVNCHQEKPSLLLIFRGVNMVEEENYEGEDYCEPFNISHKGFNLATLEQRTK